MSDARTWVTMNVFPSTIKKVQEIQKRLDLPSETEAVKVAVFTTKQILDALADGKTVTIDGAPVGFVNWNIPPRG